MFGALLARAGPPTASSGASNGGSLTATLKSDPIDAAIVSKGDMARGMMPTQITSGMLMPKIEAKFTPASSEYGLTIAGKQLTITAVGEGFSVKNDVGQMALRRSGSGFATLTLPAGPKSNYYLAFPYGFSSAGKGSLYIRSGGIVHGKIDGQNVVFYDDNLDGRYSTGDDSFCVGCDAPIGVFAPISKYFSTGKSIYQIDNLAEDGTSLQYTAYHDATGKLAVIEPSAEWSMVVAVGSKDAQLNLVSLATASASNPLAVIPGKYTLYYGGAYNRKTGKLAALVVPDSFPGVDVTAGQTQSMKLGGTLHLDFNITKQSGNKIGIVAQQIRLKGAAGEEYTAFNFDRSKPPEVFYSLGTKTVSMGKIGFS